LGCGDKIPAQCSLLEKTQVAGNRYPSLDSQQLVICDVSYLTAVFGVDKFGVKERRKRLHLNCF
jgi:hypothetical protein